jgi:hypothetical protein
MTMRGLGAILLRRWFILALALLLAVGGGVALHQSQGVYTSETVVSFLLPDKTNLSVDNGLKDSSVIAFAGAVTRTVAAGVDTEFYSEDAAPLYGAGLRQGAVVSMPNDGNQWSSSYTRAEIVVKIVGPSEAWVSATQRRLLAEVADAAAALQSSVTSPDDRIRVAPVELTKRIVHIVPSRSETLAALLALGFAALIVGTWAAVVVDRRLLPRTGIPTGDPATRAAGAPDPTERPAR